MIGGLPRSADILCTYFLPHNLIVFGGLASWADTCTYLVSPQFNCDLADWRGGQILEHIWCAHNLIVIWPVLRAGKGLVHFGYLHNLIVIGRLASLIRSESRNGYP